MPTQQSLFPRLTLLEHSRQISGICAVGFSEIDLRQVQSNLDYVAVLFLQNILPLHILFAHLRDLKEDMG